MQYKFSNGEIVDAIVKVGNFVIPIDAKFSLDNYNKMIESDDKAEVETLERNFKTDTSKELMKQPNILDLETKPQTTPICLFLLTAYIKTC